MTYPTKIIPQVIIGVTDVTAHVDLNGATITTTLTRQVSTLDLNMYNVGALGLRDWQFIELHDTTGGGTLLFGGFLQHGEISSQAGGTRQDVYPLKSADYGCFLDHAYIEAKNFPNVNDPGTPITDKWIINYCFTYFLGGGFDASTYVQAIHSYPSIQLNYQTFRQLLDMLAANANAGWYVDYNAKVHFYNLATPEFAPFSLSDNPANINLTSVFPYTNVVRIIDGTGVINRIRVIGSDVAAVGQPLIIIETDEGSHTLYGMYLSGVISNSDIVDPDVALAVASGSLNLNAYGSTGFTMDCYQLGLRAGMLVNFECLAHSFSGQLQIQKVTTQFDSAGFAVCHLEIGPYRQDLTDMIIALARRKLIATEYSTATPITQYGSVNKQADQTVADSASYTDDSELHFAGAAGVTYNVTVHYVVVETGPGPGLGVGADIAGVSGSTMVGIPISGSFTPAAPFVEEYTGTVTIGGVDSTVQFQWTRGLADAYTITVKAGSWIRWSVAP